MAPSKANCCAPSARELSPDGPQGPAVLLEPTPTRGDSSRAEQALLIPAGTFRMGTEDADGNPGDGEGPIREVSLPAFRIDAAAVTNADFADFVDRTGYVTEAERFQWSYVFASFVRGPIRRKSPRPEATPWWCGVEGAYWRAPEGPGSGIEEKLDHPVTHISHADAQAFAAWAGMRLPTEAEWEYAARGGLDQAKYPWGDDLEPDGEHRCNIWQGRFPTKNTAEDGYRSTAPARAFRPNGYGLFNVAGNVWEWCADRWTAKHPGSACTNPKGPDHGENRVMRGGSYLCHESYCNRYRVAARTSNTPDSSSGNQGFRCAADA